MPKRRMKRHLVTQPVDKPFRYIPLTQGQNAIVDAEDFEWLNQWNWSVCGKPSYAARHKGNSIVYMHREILGLGADQEVDHANHNTLDNRRENIRECTSSQNKYNRRYGRANRVKTSFKGVKWDGVKNKWRARIKIAGQEKHLGDFSSPEQAASAYDRAARLYHGEFAYLNSSVSH